MRIEDKLTILADAAKYDVSCASSGSRRSNVGGLLGNAAPSGICHTFTEDGRCVSLLKILFTNHCIYDCAYCVSRSSNDIPRAAFTVNEIVSLTIDFYRRNYIEGLFLSSGIMRSPDDTMERLVRTAKTVRDQGFNGYIHLKCVPHASRDLIRRAGLYADRLSVNIELPSEKSLRLLTREKTYASVLEPMGVIRETIAETREHRRRLRHVPQYASAGQSTQLIIGASPESDFDILNLANRLYHHQSLKRVYYSAYVPVGDVKTSLQKIAEPPLQRENRLYQADWLIRLYGFSLDDVISSKTPYLDLNLDPKQAFALRHPWLFPIDINTADRQMILRVPGIGLKSANRIVSLRRSGRLRLEHLKQIGIVVSRALPYLQCDGLPNTQWSGANPVNASSVA
ncbi:MAG: putative DNA modification/repair radical SAM protein, partial [Desulfobacterales bacterium]